MQPLSAAIFGFSGAGSAGAIPVVPVTSPTPAGRHRKRHEGRKRYAAEIDGHLVIADTKAELARKVQALRPELPDFQPLEPIEVPVAPAETPAPERKPARKARRTQEKPSGLPEVSEPIDLGLAREAARASRRARQAKGSAAAEAKRIAAGAQQQALEARIREQAEYTRRMTAIQADDEAVIELFLQILNSEDD